MDMMNMVMATSVAPSATISIVMSTSRATAAATMAMGEAGGCKLSMLLNWHTIDACFLSSAFHIRSDFTFFLSCLVSFLLVISLEFIRRFQRDLDRRLRSRNAVLQDEEYILPAEETEEKLLPNETEKTDLMRKLRGRTAVVVLEQLLRGLIHAVQFSVSYCIMLLFMYSNGYIIISILLGALVGFALFTRDTLNYRKNDTNELEEPEKICC